MAIDVYATCPCGSGKKFKWCCQPIHVQIDKAFRQDAEGQHESALRIMEEVLAQNPANPEAWGRKAQLLYQNDRVEEAEAALAKALEINPRYPFGHLLRGIFRNYEGELPDALMFFRVAADLYDPETREVLAQVYAMIADCEVKLNNFVAARSALQIAMHLQPTSQELDEQFEEIFGQTSGLPLSARREYSLLPPPANSSGLQRQTWERALQGAVRGQLAETARIFEGLSKDEPDNPAVWYNLGLTRAWLGENARALEALDQYVRLETDAAAAGAAWVLAEVVRCGHGMEEQADYREHSVVFQVRDPKVLIALLNRWQEARRLVVLEARQEDGVVSGIVMQEPVMLTAGIPAMATVMVGAYFVAYNGFLRLWNSWKEAFDAIRREVWQHAGAAMTIVQEKTLPPRPSMILTEALVYPGGKMSEEETKIKIRSHAESFFEQTWVNRPLHSLSGLPPSSAVADATLRKKLVGVIQFLEECAALGLLALYDFNRLRVKLGLPVKTPATEQGESSPSLALSADITAMSAEALDNLQTDSLSDDQLEEAHRAALKLGARELAARFARALIARPANPAKADRFPWYSSLVQLALDEGNTDAALDHVNAGEKADCEQNEGRRRNDYELRRGQIHVKRGEADQAFDVFQRLIERSPAEMRFYGAAAEGMLSVRQGAKALHFAEKGLAQARQKNDRDLEGHFNELAAAARKYA